MYIPGMYMYMCVHTCTSVFPIEWCHCWPNTHACTPWYREAQRARHYILQWFNGVCVGFQWRGGMTGMCTWPGWLPWWGKMPHMECEVVETLLKTDVVAIISTNTFTVNTVECFTEISCHGYWQSSTFVGYSAVVGKKRGRGKKEEREGDEGKERRVREGTGERESGEGGRCRWKGRGKKEEKQGRKKWQKEEGNILP